MTAASQQSAFTVFDEPIHFLIADIGLLAEPVRQRKSIITNDYSSANPWGKGYPEGHVRILRHMSLPVFDGDRISLIAGAGNKEEPYTDTDIEQLTLLLRGQMEQVLMNLCLNARDAMLEGGRLSMPFLTGEPEMPQILQVILLPL